MQGLKELAVRGIASSRGRLLRSRVNRSRHACSSLSQTPAHEIQIGRFLQDLNIPVGLSHVILVEYREYDRTSTTVVMRYRGQSYEISVPLWEAFVKFS